MCNGYGPALAREAREIHNSFDQYQSGLWHHNQETSQLFHEMIQQTGGECVPTLKLEVMQRKGHLERVRRLFTAGNFSSDWDRIAHEGILTYISGKAYVVLHRQEFGDWSVWKNLNPQYDWLLVELVVFRFGYIPPDWVERKMRESPHFSTMLAKGVPLINALASGALKLAGGASGHGLEGLSEVAHGAQHLSEAGHETGEQIHGFKHPGAAGGVRPGVMSQIAHPDALTPAAERPGAELKIIIRQLICDEDDLRAEMENRSAYYGDSLGVEGSIAHHTAAVLNIVPVKTGPVSFLKTSVVMLRCFQNRSGYQTFCEDFSKMDHPERKEWLGLRLPLDARTDLMFTGFGWRRQEWQLGARLNDKAEDLKAFLSNTLAHR